MMWRNGISPPSLKHFNQWGFGWAVGKRISDLCILQGSPLRLTAWDRNLVEVSWLVNFLGFPKCCREQSGALQPRKNPVLCMIQPQFCLMPVLFPDLAQWRWTGVICGNTPGKGRYTQPWMSEAEIKFQNLLLKQATFCPIKNAGEIVQRLRNHLKFQ